MLAQARRGGTVGGLRADSHVKERALLGSLGGSGALARKGSHLRRLQESVGATDLLRGSLQEREALHGVQSKRLRDRELVWGAVLWWQPDAEGGKMLAHGFLGGPRGTVAGQVDVL